MSRFTVIAVRRWRGQWLVLASLILSIGLGVGANLIVMDSVRQLLQSEPVRSNSDGRLVRLSTKTVAPGRVSRGSSVSYPLFEALGQDSSVTAGIAAYAIRPADIEVRGQTVRANASIISNNFFDVLRIAPLLGGASALEWPADGVVVSYHFWRGTLGGTAQPIGVPIRIADRRFIVAAVVPPNFSGLDFERVDLWAPLTSWPGTGPQDYRTNSSESFLRLVARVRPGVSLEQASQRLSTVLWSSGLVSPTGGGNRRLSISAERLSRAEGPAQERLNEIGWVLLAMSLLLLAATSANVAGVLVGRVLRSERELAVRLALGATPRDILAVLVADAAPIALLGTGAGALAALLASDQIRTRGLPSLAWSDSVALPELLLLAAALGAASLVSLVLLPWRQARRTSLTSVLNGAAFGSTRRRSRSRSFLVGVQASGATLLMLSAMLFIRTFITLGGERLGFNADQVGVIDFGNATDSVPVAQLREWLTDFASRLRAVSGVIDVGVGSGIPLRQSFGSSIAFEGRVVEPLATGGPYEDALDSRALSALDARLVRGRLFRSSDDAGSEPVVIVNETMAQYIWGQRDPLGSCLYFRVEKTCRLVIGVLHDIQRDNVLEGRTLQTFVPLDQAPPYMRPRAVFVRAESPTTLRPTLRRLSASSRLAGLPYRYDTFLAILEPELVTWRIAGFVLGLYGVIALLVSVSGVFGTIAFFLAERHRELSIRRALGAPFGSLAADIGARLSRDAAVGVLVAVFTMAGVWSRSGSLFFGTRRSDLALGATAAVFVICVVVASGVLWGSQRLWRNDPTATLRSS